MLQLTLNPGLTLTGFRTTRPCWGLFDFNSNKQVVSTCTLQNIPAESLQAYKNSRRCRIPRANFYF